MARIVENTEGIITQIDARTDATKRQRDAAASLRDAVLALQVAEGKKTPEEEVKEKGANTISDLRAQAEAELAAAQAKNAQVEAAIRQSLREVTAAQEALRKVSGNRDFLKSADQSEAANTAANLAEAEVNRIENQGPSVTVAATRGGALGLGVGAIDYLLQMREHAKTLEAAEAEQEKLKAAAAGLADLAEDERAAYESRVTQQEKLVDAAKRSLDQLRAQQVAVTKDLVAADQNARLTEKFSVPTAQIETAAELAKIEAKKADEKRKEDERAERERIAEEQRRQRDAIDEEAKAAVGPLDARARRMGAKGLDDQLVSKAESIAQGLSDGVSTGEAERGLAAIDSIIARLPAALQSQAQAAMAPFESKLRQLDAAVKQLESQSRNASNRQ
jgi:hypothetical protein